MIEKYAIIKVFMTLRNQDRQLSIRDVSRMANLSPSSAKYSLDLLYENGFVAMKKIGRSHLFKVNDSFVAKHAKILISLSEIHNSGLVNELLSKNNSIISIILYGSVARGEDNPDSDIDLLIISRNRLEKFSINSDKDLKREITSIKYTIAEWRQKAKTDKAFYDRVIMDGISLHGEKPVVL